MIHSMTGGMTDSAAQMREPKSILSMENILRKHTSIIIRTIMFMTRKNYVKRRTITVAAVVLSPTAMSAMVIKKRISTGTNTAR